MRRLFLIIFFLMIAGNGWTATYYVSPSGSNTSPYDTWAKAANLPGTLLPSSVNPGAGTHYIFIAPGTYASTVNITSAQNNWAGVTVYGVSQAGVDASCNSTACYTYPAAKGVVVIDRTGVGAYPLRASLANVTMKYIGATGATGAYATLYVTGNGFTGDNLYVYDASPSGAGSYISGTGYSVTNSIFSGAKGTAGIQIDGAGAGTIRDTRFENSVNSPFGKDPSGSAAMAVQYTSSGINYLYNSIVTGSDGFAVSQEGAGTVYLRDNTIWNNGSRGVYPPSGTYYTLRRTAGFSITTITPYRHRSTQARII
jgi:hypothetical protein